MPRLLTWTITVHENGPESHEFENDLQCGDGCSFADVYRGFMLVRDELERQIRERRTCPANPKYGAGLEGFD